LSGDTITYDPDEAAACTDPVLASVGGLFVLGQSSQTCIEFYSHILAVIHIGSAADSGTIDIMYDTFTLMTIGFAPSSVYYEWNLAQCRLIFEAMFAQGFIPDPEFGSAFEGIIRTTLTELGEDHGRINLSIQQAIKIVDGDEDINIASTPKVFELTANGPAGTANAEIGLSTLMSMFIEEDGFSNDHLIALDMAGMTLNADLTPTKLMVSNVGLGSRPLTMDVDDPSSPGTDFSFGMSTFGFTVDGTDGSVTFDQAYNSDFVINDPFELFSSGLSGSTNTSVSAGSKWTLLGTNFSGEPVFQATSGTAAVTGTDSFLGASGSFGPGSCFALWERFGFPLLAEACP